MSENDKKVPLIIWDFHTKWGMWNPLGACSHEPGTVNYPKVMVAPGQALPRVHMMICCPGASSSSSDQYEFIWIHLVFTQIVTENKL